jgi:molybdopterin-guanine dinucleotide biosynthesis protein A
MGSDKAFVVVDGRPLVVAVADALWEGGCHPVECQGGDLDGLASLGLPAFADSAAGAGPVAAIVDALGRHDGHVVIAACDLPDLDGTTVEAVVRAGVAARKVAVAHSAGRDHLLGYWPAGTATLLVAGSVTGSYRDALDRVDALRVTVPAHVVRNVNTVGDI